MSPKKQQPFDFSNVGSKIHNLAELIQPGLYLIKCKATGKLYIGQTQNLLERLGKHSAVLIKQIADNAALQRDWIRFGPSGFEIHVLAIGSVYASAKERALEEYRITKSAIDQGLPVYNQLTQRTGKRNTRKPVMIHGIEYYSTTFASEKLGIPYTTLRRYIVDPYMPEYKKLKEREVGYSTISVNGIIYNGLIDVVEAGLADNSQMVMRRLKSKTERWKDWFYIERAADIRKTNRDNREKG